jgi:hypothetical protein
MKFPRSIAQMCEEAIKSEVGHDRTSALVEPKTISIRREHLI